MCMNYILSLILVSLKKASDVYVNILESFWNAWSYSYLQIKKANLPRYKDICFCGKPHLYVAEGSNVSIGKGFVCRSGIIQSVDNYVSSKIVVSQGASLTIGENSGISNVVLYSTDSISIGSNVNIGAGTMIFDTDFHSTDWRDRIDREKDRNCAKSKPISIGDNVFIGARSIVTKGVTIGDRSMVAAGSVVAHDIPADELWGGNPARFIRKNI